MKLKSAFLSMTFILCILLINAVKAYGAPATERLAGENRYKTAVEISRAGWQTAENVLLATGENYPDALCAAPLAKRLNAPILLTDKNTLQNVVVDELNRLRAKNVFIIGGMGVLSENVENQITSMGIKCTRLWGSDRYGTSVEIAKQLGETDEIVVTTGEDFPDALSISPIAARMGIPIILLPKDRLPESVRDYINVRPSGIQIKKTYVIGSSVDNTGILQNLVNPERIYGPDKYATNINIVNKFDRDIDVSKVFIATGDDFPDALAGSVLASLTSSPIILVPKSPSISEWNYINSKIFSIQKIRVLGGEGAVPKSTLQALLSHEFTDIRDVPAKAIELHSLAWDDMIKKAANDSYAKYAFYATRSLAVKHPEMYLQADNIIIKNLLSHNGTRELYFENSGNPEKYEPIIDKFFRGYGTKLQLADIDLSKFSLRKRSSLFDVRLPFIELVDERVGAIYAILRRDNDRATELEKAFMYYFIRKYQSNEKPFIVYCNNEKAYVISNNMIYEMTELKNVNVVQGTPILILNEKSVWYPIMDRDDTSKYADLKQVCNLVAGSNKKYNKQVDEKYITKLKGITGINNENERILALRFAAKIHNENGYKIISPGDLYVTSMDGLDWSKPLKHTLQSQYRNVSYNSNLLHPMTSYIASLESVKDILDEYRKQAGVNAYTHSLYSIKWLPTDFWYDIDDQVLSKMSGCGHIATIAHAILDMANVENYEITWLSTKKSNQRGGHYETIVPKEQISISNGMSYSLGSFFAMLESQSVSISSIDVKGKWINTLGLSDAFTLNLNTASDAVKYINISTRNLAVYGYDYGIGLKSGDEVLDDINMNKQKEAYTQLAP